MTKKKVLLIGISVLIIAAIIGSVAFFTTHIRVGNTFVKKGTSVLDLTDQALTEQEYLELCDQHPDAEILWSVPIQGGLIFSPRGYFVETR